MGVLSIAMQFGGKRELDLALALLTALDAAEMRWHQLPALYESGVRYKREDAKRCWAPVPGGCEDWLSARELLRQRQGDCEDLCCYRAAELRLQGERATAVPLRTPSGGWHIVVKRGSGKYEDPSVKLGMKVDARSYPKVLGLMIAGAWG